MKRMLELHFDTKDITPETLTDFASNFCEVQRSIMWWIGDAAIAARKHFGDDNMSQAFPPETSPGLIRRCETVAKAYPPEKRNPIATWTQHMQVAKEENRFALVDLMVNKGQTTDESRAEMKSRWLLAVDVNYFLHRFWFSGAGVEAAAGVSGWVARTVDRLKEKGLTDVVCCFDDRTNHRKALTEDWEHKYKDRPAKDEELVHQLRMVRELLEQGGFCCVSVDGMEADDCMATYARIFKGRVTLLTQDKDVRQCLSDKCNILLDVEWHDDESSGEKVPEYKWLSAKQHTADTGIHPSKWTQFQAIMGDNVDGVRGAEGIGEKGAADIIKEFGTVEAAIQAAKAEDDRIAPRKRASLIEFEAKAETTLQLVTLRTDLYLPTATRI